MSDAKDSSQIEIGAKALIVGNKSGHSFNIGQIVVIFRTCIEGYKVIPINCDNTSEWTYVEYVDLEQCNE